MTIQQIYIFCFFFFFTIICKNESVAQSSNIGTPPISNYLKKEYKASPQNWDIAQAKNGLMYFANSDGLLEFDGIEWRCHKVSNQTVIRSVEIAPDGKIFVGAQGEFGYFYANKNGVLNYQSLKSILPENRQAFADVWDIEILEDKVFFRTGNMILMYQEDQLKLIYEGQSISVLAKVQNELYINDINKGFLKLVGDSFSAIPMDQSFRNKELTSVLPFGKDSLLLTIPSKGLYIYTNGTMSSWELNDNDFIKNNNVYCTVQMNENNFVLGTSTAGVCIVNKKGKVIRHIDRNSGLQVNNVLSLFVDQSKNLWVGLNNGIDYVETSSPFTSVSPNNELKSTGYAIKIHKGQIYFGSANGVYSNQWKSYYNPILSTDYKLVGNSNGQVYNLSIHEEDLLMNHHEGVFKIENNTANKVSKKKGAWMQLALAKNKLLSGHYDGLSILEKDTEWKEVADFKEDWLESCRIIVQDENNIIWVSHPYRGVYKVAFNEDFLNFESARLYDSNDGFPSNLQIYAFKIGEEVVFCTERGIYSYNHNKDRFELNEKWNLIFNPQIRVRRLVEAPNGDIWFVTDKEIGVLKVRDGGVYKDIQKQTFPQLQGKLVNAFEAIYPFDEDNIFIAQDAGFSHYNPKQTTRDSTFTTLIRLAQNIHLDSVIYGGNYTDRISAPILDYKNNAIRFAFATTYFGNLENNLFQYHLKGYDNKWSPWSAKSQIDYTNLKSGDYKFQVRAKNIHGIISNIVVYDFKISPPWYATKLAYLFYLLLIGGSLFSLIFIPRKKFEREKAALEVEQKKTLLQKDQEYQLAEQKRRQQISKLEKEKLQLQILSKNQELASNTMHLAQKSEMLKKIKDDIQKIARESIDPSISKQLNKVIRKVSADERLDKDWQQFAKHFDQVHSQFLHRLQAAYPMLSPKDHRLCAYLRMNLTSKEMAPLMNISVRSVEVARYRLRKKMELKSEVNLVEFMMGF